MKPTPPITDSIPIALRTHGRPEGRKNGPPWSGEPPRGPSKWNLIFDTETTIDAAQRVKIGAYQLRYADRLKDQGVFYDEGALTKRELATLRRYAKEHGIKLLTLAEFVEQVFVRCVYHWQATCIGFNLPFDMSRIAYDHAPARGRKMRGGFSFEMVSNGKPSPRLRIKHLSRRISLIDFSGIGQKLPRGMRKRQVRGPRRRPAFVDVHTLAAAILGRSYSLKGLQETLQIPTPKLDVAEHGKVTPEYIRYAIQDVQVTWECFEKLCQRYEAYGLVLTPIRNIYSEASVGKAYLRQFGVRPWREVQPDFPADLIGKIMGTYYGGRSEVHLRRMLTQVTYCDFTSMYPTVCTLMDLWRYVIATGVTTRDATAEARDFLESVKPNDFQRRDLWSRLPVIVQVKPDADLFPVRAKYGNDQHFTIGLNHLTSREPIWYTLADCIAGKLLTGKAPEVVSAIAFEPMKPQSGLVPASIAGNPEYRVDPLEDDFNKRLIELRQQVKRYEKAATGPEKDRLRDEQLALKITANSVSYGIFVQLNVDERAKPAAIRCYPQNGPEFLRDMLNFEEPGEYFHPLLATLITGAARLMLALAERQVTDHGLDWAFCDTDSMAISKQDGMPDATFFEKVRAIQKWFTALNPYDADLDLLKIEDANYRLANGTVTNQLEPLFCLAVSSKRHVLFNIGVDRTPIVRKASAHGLGHLRAPYQDKDAPANIPAPAVSLNDLGVLRWHHDYWWRVAESALRSQLDKPNLSLPNFDAPAVSQFAATSPRLLAWFDRYNENRAPSERVRPFGFLLMFQADPASEWAAGTVDLPRAVGPFNDDPAKAANQCFDRETGEPVPVQRLLAYRQVLASYHRHPESKFLNASYADTGATQRRHIEATSITYIGKEANRWEEQSYIGYDPEAEVAYGLTPDDRQQLSRSVRRAADAHGQRALAKAARVSLQQLSAIVTGAASPTEKTLAKLLQAAAALDAAGGADSARRAKVIAQARAECERRGLREFTRSIGIDDGNLTKALTGERKISPKMLAKLEQAFQVKP